MEREYKCPLCNGLIAIRVNCPECGFPMEDCGKVQDYLDPYQPYLDEDIAALQQEEGTKCVHLFRCPRCGRDKRIAVNEILAP
ncbi:MAG: hypothetical protein DIU66_007780 [Bacillota bacterium]|nr:MAG: hypothetical protein DIU66_03335 [Bacillota bacterium]